MPNAYIWSAMRPARYEIVEDDGSLYGDIPANPRVSANAKTLEVRLERIVAETPRARPEAARKRSQTGEVQMVSWPPFGLSLELVGEKR